MKTATLSMQAFNSQPQDKHVKHYDLNSRSTKNDSDKEVSHLIT